MNRSPDASTDTERLWRELSESLRTFIRRRVGSEADADDILQEVFVRIHTGLSRLRNQQSVHAWVYRIARNAIADHHRAAARAPLGAVEARGVAARESEDEDLTASLARCLRPLVEQLPEHYAEAILLTELGGLSQRAAAAQTGVSVSGMKTRVRRARSRLGGLLLACCDVDLDRRRGVLDYRERSPVPCACDCTPPEE